MFPRFSDDEQRLGDTTYRRVGDQWVPILAEAPGAMPDYGSLDPTLPGGGYDAPMPGGLQGGQRQSAFQQAMSAALAGLGPDPQSSSGAATSPDPRVNLRIGGAPDPLAAGAPFGASSPGGYPTEADVGDTDSRIMQFLKQASLGPSTLPGNGVIGGSGANPSIGVANGVQNMGRLASPLSTRAGWGGLDSEQMGAAPAASGPADRGPSNIGVQEQTYDDGGTLRPAVFTYWDDEPSQLTPTLARAQTTASPAGQAGAQPSNPYSAENLKLGVNDVYRQQILRAAEQTGLPPQTVAAIINAEAAKGTGGV